MPNELETPKGPTVNWLLHGFISLALLAIMTMTGWTLNTVQKLTTSSAVSSLEIAHIKKDIDTLTKSMNRNLDSKYSLSEAQRLMKKVDDLQETDVRMWEVINKMRSFQSQGSNQ